jgi:hypothetical protein
MSYNPSAAKLSRMKAEAGREMSLSLVMLLPLCVGDAI